MGNTFVAYENLIPLLAPADITSTATASAYMDLKHANRAAFLCIFGNVNSATTTNTENVTVQAVATADGAEVTIPFVYRKSGALNANTWGAITADSATAGLAIAVTEDNILLWIEIDPAVYPDYRYYRVVFTDVDDMANCVVGVVGVVDQKFKQTTFASATAAASA